VIDIGETVVNNAFGAAAEMSGPLQVEVPNSRSATSPQTAAVPAGSAPSSGR
jgi:hypothetical protein